ncbi:peptidase domain-containing ABC transporter [Flavobacterium sp. NRK F7]|uniref:peptidase domain-containing ABC transporter n=1 Tax=Flavobacterium sp. NRK F7 TaxID=2954930 RepID=UPI00209039EB|nr:ATP-binding cassette domain-containing protein [Flavobacterium sp. NRK F7]MCO6162281.1 ATP-binding cassette domain-containing protein [Flavobacterium sp. NRK F7]
MTPLERFKNLILIDKRDIYQIFLYSIFGGLISLTLPLGIQSIVNFIQAGKVSTSWGILVIVVVIGVILVGVFKIMQYRITENLQQKIFVRSSFDFSFRFPKIKFNQLYNQYPPELANRFFDTLSVQKGFSKLLLDISAAILQILFGIILLSLYHPFFILFGILLLGLLYFIFKANFKVGLETSLKESKYKYKVAHWIQEIARNHLSFKNQNLFEFSLSKNDDLVSDYLNYREKHFKILKRQFIQLVGFKTIITAGLLIIGGILVLSQQMNIGQFVAAEIIILTIITAVEKLFGGLELFYDVLTSLEKLGAVSDLEIEKESNSQNFFLDNEGITLEVKNVYYKYPQAEIPILNNINLTIRPKERVVIKGENGSGKSTLIRLLAKIIDPSTGTLFVNNVNIDKINIGNYRSKIGLITRDDSTFEGTILDNITCQNENLKINEINTVLEQVQLIDFIKTLPLGLDTPLFPGGKQINASVVQKIILARCILSKPEIILLEDPINKIDKKQSQKIIDFLMDKNHPWTVVVTASSKDWLPHATQIITLENGQIV